MELKRTGRTSRWQWRLLLFLLLGSWMMGGPAYRQVFEGRSFWFPRWVMFHGFGKEICDARFYSVAANGTMGLIDRYAVLDRPRSWSTNRALVRMKNPGQVRSVARQLCSALGSDADVRVLARCGSRGEWQTRIRLQDRFCPKTAHLEWEGDR